MYMKQSTRANKFSIIRAFIDLINDQALKIQYSDFNRTPNTQ